MHIDRGNRLRTFSILPLLTILQLPALSAAGPGSQATEHVVLISVDGLRPEFYLDSSWPAPMMQKMCREGAHAKRVRGIFPSVTYPTHTTLLTGVMPAQHGIDYNSPFEEGGQTGRWYWEEEWILAKTLWDAVRETELTSASVFWPVSVGAPIDFNIPEIWPLDHDKDFVDAIREMSTPPGILAEIEKEATGRLSARNFSFGKLTLDERSGEMAAYLLTKHRPNLLTLHLIGVDTFQHDFGRSGTNLELAVAAIDRIIARLVEAVDLIDLLDRTTFVITGDHGFIDNEIEVAPNVWLVEAGLLENRPDRGRWRASVHKMSAVGFVHLANPNDQRTLNEVIEILESLPAETQSLFEILDRDELDRRQTAPDAALGLAPLPGTYISDRMDPPAIRPKGGASHGHLPELEQMHTGFIAWGAGVRSGASSDSIGIEQIAPLVRDLLGLDMPTPAAAPDVLSLLSDRDQSGTTPP